MASIPQRQPSQRRTSPEQTPRQTDSSQAQQPASPVRVRSATSEDSQTVFVNAPNLEDKADQQQPRQQSQSTETPTTPPYHDEDPSVKTCWICFSDSTEDTPDTSPWRDPCPCALVAHEACLLDWVAETESPKNVRNRPIGAPQILCPQCKSEIKIARPRSYVVDAVGLLESLVVRAVTPGALLVLSNVVAQASLAHGMHSIYRVFGAEDGYRILRPLIRQRAVPPLDLDLPFGQLRDGFVGVAVEHMKHWRLYLGVPLITPMLVLSRFKVADSILPVLPIAFFATQTNTINDGLDFAHWPPSASMAFAVLPYFRAAYNAYYERFWAEKEKQWLKEIQPRAGQGQNEENADGGDGGVDQVAEDADEGGDIFEVRIDRGVWEEDWDDEAVPEEPARQDMPIDDPATPQEALQAEEGEQAAPAPNVPDNRPERNQQRNNRPANAQQLRQQQQQQQGQQDQQGRRRLSFSPVVMALNVFGALIFPTLAECSGELLKLILPKSWTSLASSSTMGYRPGVRIGAKGLLQEKWGRSLVGGCLYVVFKDALVLYVRWRMAQMHRQRRVVDCDRTMLKGKGTART